MSPDGSHDRGYVVCAAVSCVASIVLFYIAPWIISAVSGGYSHLPKHTQRDLDARVGSSIHAVFVGLASLYLMVHDQQLENIAWGHSPEALYMCSIVLGYMVGDLLLISWHYDALWNVTFIVHHLLVILVEYVTISTRKCVWFALYRHVSELSTPFINERFFLDSIKYDRSSALFMGNGIVMTIVFFLVRVASIPIYHYLVYGVYVSGNSFNLGFIWYLLVYGGILLDLMNVFWFWKMLKGAKKVLMGNAKKQRQEKAQ